MRTRVAVLAIFGSSFLVDQGIAPMQPAASALENLGDANKLGPTSTNIPRAGIDQQFKAWEVKDAPDIASTTLPTETSPTETLRNDAAEPGGANSASQESKTSRPQAPSQVNQDLKVAQQILKGYDDHLKRLRLRQPILQSGSGSELFWRTKGTPRDRKLQKAVLLILKKQPKWLLDWASKMAEKNEMKFGGELLAHYPTGELQDAATLIYTHYPGLLSAEKRADFKASLPRLKYDSLQKKRAWTAAKLILKDQQDQIKITKKAPQSKLSKIWNYYKGKFTTWRLRRAIAVILRKKPDLLDERPRNTAFNLGVDLDQGEEKISEATSELKNAADLIYKKHPTLLSKHKITEKQKEYNMRKAHQG
ncbi:uncharacterized protein PGTG_03650 [Puccinia graminis f. sp. tritici CRL 75-36-700-3]|uniref:Uncharacterized protein n=1 Tax=Puccinia graminis f. sp. tritici (strain CRL 75-36-700-3 / race SCCL) TaxID=418459 RepID=E3K069_PUCGT|nr:uncharacterized protein PGTG_03650 [Puccinia graminis f. sp. tritici CRL 75-36-700-3]EFP77694.2 hypothetical protein PGTG_03650 [Puccinia graminis f. sp. tritici CRL 75-36-700-3]